MSAGWAITPEELRGQMWDAPDDRYGFDCCWEIASRDPLVRCILRLDHDGPHMADYAGFLRANSDWKKRIVGVTYVDS